MSPAPNPHHPHPADDRREAVLPTASRRKGGVAHDIVAFRIIDIGEAA